MRHPDLTAPPRPATAPPTSPINPTAIESQASCLVKPANFWALGGVCTDMKAKLIAASGCALAVVAVSCSNPPPQGEFAGDGTFKATVSVCRTSARCVPLHCITFHLKAPVYVVMRHTNGDPQFSISAVNCAGEVSWFQNPGTFIATLRPTRIGHYVTSSVHIQITQGQNTTFRLYYHLPPGDACCLRQ